MLPTVNAEPERYKGRPLIRVLEWYILDTIGELPEEHKAVAQKLVEKTFGIGDWRATVRKKLNFKDAIDAAIASSWTSIQATAAQRKEEVHPIQFAKLMVDQNFAKMIDRIS